MASNVGTSQTILYHWCVACVDLVNIDAELFGAVDGGRHSLDYGCVDQHQHGTVPRFGWRYAAASATHIGLRDADHFHWDRCCCCFIIAMDTRNFPWCFE